MIVRGELTIVPQLRCRAADGPWAHIDPRRLHGIALPVDDVPSSSLYGMPRDPRVRMVRAMRAVAEPFLAEMRTSARQAREEITRSPIDPAFRRVQLEAVEKRELSVVARE